MLTASTAGMPSPSASTTRAQHRLRCPRSKGACARVCAARQRRRERDHRQLSAEPSQNNNKTVLALACCQERALARACAQLNSRPWPRAPPRPHCAGQSSDVAGCGVRRVAAWDGRLGRRAFGARGDAAAANWGAGRAGGGRGGARHAAEHRGHDRVGAPARARLRPGVQAVSRANRAHRASTVPSSVQRKGQACGWSLMRRD